ncbi:uncharacterized protein N7477_000875 [Penicillium maclennaniae]|uniref:uncharacterized protein n=1 Tax=Penicillium maclennaniae TaxID=1343394 RepID=UPI00254267DE|nr:uncharacterized protein N7477_000875 [Penicillium maclennaniae]KAJ5684530.1 hypothetical protein N7477_000875 [Penicillium maclennaniae]
MAFRAPAQAPRRRTSYSASQRPPSIQIPGSPTEQPEEDTAQWVLFSPTAPTHTTSTDRTAGASRLSDFGSFGTATRSAAGPEGEVDDEEALDDQYDEDGTELDSLDDGLHAFRAPSFSPASPTRLDQGPPAMLPAHDGLGSFQASSQQIQDQLWQHEQYNPQRRPYGYSQHRRHSRNRTRDPKEEIHSWKPVNCSTLYRLSFPVNVTDPLSEEEHPPESEVEIDKSFWQRITRKVIRDLIGIDENLLSVIFGESLPLEADTPEKDTEDLSIESVLAREPEAENGEPPLWQSRVLQRIAHELGILVHQLCEHPGAFTTYYQMTKDISSEYAGMSLNRLAESNILQNSESTAQPSANTTADSMPSPHFMPTLRDPNREHEAQWGIEENEFPGPDSVSESTRVQQEQEYWEHGLDVMMVFRYLRTRFSRRGYMSNDKFTSSPSPRHTQDPSRRAAIIRQHHPLVARAHSRSQTQSRRASHVSGPVGVSSPLVRPHLRRPSSSCASQSKLSAISSRRTLTGSSRNYWDIGGSVGSNSAIGVGGGAGLGAWGEA